MLLSAEIFFTGLISFSIFGLLIAALVCTFVSTARLAECHRILLTLLARLNKLEARAEAEKHQALPHPVAGPATPAPRPCPPPAQALAQPTPAPRPQPPKPQPPVLVRRPQPMPPPKPQPAPHATPESAEHHTPESAAKPTLSELLDRALTVALDWLLVSGRFAPKQALSREAALAIHWLIRTGVLTLIIGTSFLVRWCILHGLLGPLGRVILLALAGFALIGGGLALLRSTYRLIGEGLAAVGTTLLYFTLYAATILFKLLPLSAGFTAMGLLTLGAGAMALGLRLPSVATIVAAGGLLTPALLPAPEPNLPLLYLYLGTLATLIALGAWWRKWEPLAYLAFLLSWILTFAAGKVPLTPAWTLALHLLFLLSFFAQLIRRQWRTTVLAIAALPAAEALFWCARIWVQPNDYANFACALLLAGTYATLSLLLQLRGERRMFWCTALLSTLLLALAPLFLPALRAQHYTLPFIHALIACALLELGHRLREPALTTLGHGAALFLLALFDLLVLSDLLACYAHNCAPGTLDFGLLLLATLLLSVHGIWRVRAPTLAVFSGITTWFVLTRFTASLFSAGATQLVAISIAWGLYAIVLILLGLRFRQKPVRLAALALFGLTLVKVFLVDLSDVSLLMKMLAALPLGALLILGAVLYLKFSRAEK